MGKFNVDDTRCAPTKEYKNGSCFEYDSLVKIAGAYNKKYSDKIRISKDKKDLVEQLEKKLKKECDDQVCWLKHNFTREILDESMKNTFRPAGPTSKNAWLSTTDIDKVLEQYHEKYPNFMYLGTVPSDFERIPVLGFQDLDFDSLLKKGKYKLGMVINLDEHNQSGSHWVALYIDLKHSKVYFFDSFGKKPIKNIKLFINKVIRYLYKKEYGKEIPIKYLDKAIKKFDRLSKPVQEALKKIDIRYNTVQHQKANTECGVYSINFILRLLKGDSFDKIVNNPVRDDEMEECREKYFNNYKI
jgi:hypothetical protein